jgi:hypothetical protein
MLEFLSERVLINFLSGLSTPFSYLHKFAGGGDEVANLILLANNLAQQYYPRAYVGH